MYSTTENVSGSKYLTNGVTNSTTPSNVVKAEAKRIVNPLTKQELYAQSNQSSSFANRSKLESNDRDQNLYKKTDFRFASCSSKIYNTGQTKNDSFFDMLQDYQPTVLGVIGTNQRSPGPAEFMQDKEIQNHSNSSSNKDICTDSCSQVDSNSSNTKITRDLKVKNKIHRFLIHPKSKTDDNNPLGLSLLSKTPLINEDMASQPNYSLPTKRTLLTPEEIQEQQRQRSFGHYDCQSVAAIIKYLKTNKKLSSNNISSNPHNSSSFETKYSFQDLKYGNELLENCSHFCNEIGGENDGRFNSRKFNNTYQTGMMPRWHKRQVTPCSVSVLESLPNETLWRVGVCPFQNDSCPIEFVDHGAHYYKRYFYNQTHENWFGIDENLGPIAISIKKEKVNNISSDQHHNNSRHQFRMIIRSSDLLTLRGLVIEDYIINYRQSGKSITSKELVDYIAPDIQLSCLRMGVNGSNTEQQLLKLDEQGLQSKYKVGILYCRSGQSSEEDMYNNEYAGPAFTEFLDIIGKRVRLKGFQHYKAGLDNKSDSTGTHSIYAFYKNCEIMFHVCTMLPFTPNNRQQLLRKRHIGNDIVTIIFQEPGALPFDPSNIRSQFQHVFLIVRAVNPCSSNTTYRVAITRSKEVPIFGPPLPASALFSRNKMFAEFILAKTINAENAAHRSDKFANLAIRTRREYLKDLCINYSTNTPIDAGNKFSIFNNRKKEKTKIQFCGDLSQRGAICWRIMLQDHGLAIDCLLGISVETFVIIEESSKTLIFAIPTRSILGWTTFDNSFRLFYHNGECITFNMYYIGTKEEEEVTERLEAVTFCNGALELNMRRNMMGQLGFHVQPDGIVTQVDATGQAWAANMRRGYRLVEVCKIVVATLSYSELIDLLKTSAQMNAIVIKSLSDGSPRIGCFNKNCKVNILSQEFIQSSSNKFLLEKDGYRVKSFLRKDTDLHSSLNYCSNGSYEQRSLPHKSKISSGYNTRSNCFSSSSLGDEYKQIWQQSNSSSPHSLQNEKWYNTDDADNRKTTAHSVNPKYSLKLFENSLMSDDPSGFYINASTSLLNDESRVNEWLQSKSSNFPQPENKKILDYETTKFQNASFSQNYNYIASNKGVTECHLQSPQKLKILDSNTAHDNTNVFSEFHAIPSMSASKATKVNSTRNGIIPSKNNVQQGTRSYSNSNQFRPDVLELFSSNCFSNDDSLKANIIPVVERNSNYKMDSNVPSPTENGLKEAEKQQPNISTSDLLLKNHPVKLNSNGSATRQTQRISEFNNTVSTTIPLLPYSNKLDWTTLVDTATKAIILQHKDDNSCKFFT